MQKIKLRFSYNDTVVSKGIRFFTFSKFSHVDYIFDNGAAYSSLPSTGVGFNSDRNDYVEYYEVEVNDKKKIENFLLKQKGKGYDWTAIFGFIVGRDWQEDTDWFCFELIAAAIEQDTKLFDQPLNRITANDLTNHPKIVKLYGKG